MPAAAQAVLTSWSFPPWATALNLLTALLYTRGWIELRPVMPGRFTTLRLASFLGGLATLEIALASPIDAFDPFFLTDHMLQHMLLMMIVPPLVLLGDPPIPLLRGLPRWIRRNVLGPFLSWPAIVRLGQLLTHPAVGLFAMSLAMIGWHLPAPYELALRSSGWHEVEHATFLVTSLLFWWPVCQPWPSRPRWPRWTMPLYLLLADFVNTALSAFLTFSGRVFYPSYLDVPRLGGISAQNDQVAAGAMMWVVGSFAFLVPAAVITAKLLSPSPPAPHVRRLRAPHRSLLQRAVLPALTLVLPLAALAYAWLTPNRIDIDEDVVRLQDVAGPFRISVFAEPGSLPAGDSDVAVLVQGRDSGEVILDAVVDLAVQPINRSSSEGSGEAGIVRATREQAANRLLAAGTVDLPNPGLWELRVSVRRGSDQGTVSASFEVEPSESKPGGLP